VNEHLPLSRKFFAKRFNPSEVISNSMSKVIDSNSCAITEEVAAQASADAQAHGPWRTEILAVLMPFLENHPNFWVETGQDLGWVDEREEMQPQVNYDPVSPPLSASLRIRS
jgi:hypothetical protein